jgi:NAD(P)-dependent dehydrogenase (short-subunit alcohol dehydrogenase family)
MKHELRQMNRQGSGAIVNCSSIGGLRGDRGILSYTASKHGVIGLTRAAALEYAAKGIRVNAVCPGTIDTAFARAAIGDEKDFEALSKSLPIGRVGKPEEIASVVLWLCSPGASYVVGHALVVNGGHPLGAQLPPAGRKEIYNSVNVGSLPVTGVVQKRYVRLQ